MAEKIKIAVGTTSEYKLKFLKEVLDEIGIEAEVFSVKAPSLVSEQPITDDETRTGSLNRAEFSLKQIEEADFGLGIEGGYHKNKEGKYEIFCYASIVDRKGIKVSAVSHKFPLPKFHNEKIESDVQLCGYVEEYYKDAKSPIKKYIGEMIDSRRLFIVDSIRQALLRYLGREEF